MKTNWRTNWNKLTVGGCGSQIGMVLSCGLVSGLALFCAVCAASSLFSITAYDMARTLIQSPETAAVVEIVDLPPTPATDEAEPSRRSSAPTAIPVPPSLPVTMLPETGELVVIPAPPKPIVTATEGRVNLRRGPGTAYDRVAILPAGASLEIVGRNGEATWWLVSTTEGLLWVSGRVVTAANLNDAIPIVDITVPPKSALPRPAAIPAAAVQATPSPAAANSAPPPEIAGTPTAGPNQNRLFVEDTVGYKRLWVHLSYAPLSTSFSPKGDQIAITEGVKIHTVAGDGSYGRVLLLEDEIQRPVGQLVWSPDGQRLAFTVDKKAQGCKPCRVVGIIRQADESILYLNTPNQMDSDAPRWTQDGRLLVNVYPVEPADGTTFVFNTAGQGRPARGIYTLSSSHEGQKFLPWHPGRIWQAGISERPDAYYND